MQGSRSAYTRTQILETAARLFAHKGYGSTSLREITAAAGVNLSSVNYHFGSKAGLIQAVYQQQLDTLNRERLTQLDRLEMQAAGRPLEPCKVVEAFFCPLIRLAIGHLRESPPFTAQAGRMSDTNGFIHALIMNGHSGTIGRFRAALLNALPAMPEREIFWRFQFMLGAICCALSSMDGLLLAPNPQKPEPLDTDRFTRRLMTFLSGGLLAPCLDANDEMSGIQTDTGPAAGGQRRSLPGSSHHPG